MRLDTVEIVMCWEESLGISVPDRDAEHLVTPAKAVEYLAGLVGAKDNRSFPCLGQRAFHRVRKCLTRINEIPREHISPDVHSGRRVTFGEKGHVSTFDKWQFGYGAVTARAEYRQNIGQNRVSP